MGNSLTDQPSDILDHICAFVASPRDILSFALTSKQIYYQAIPDHIEFRHLRCDLRRISLWKKLSELPAVASRFLSLEVIVEDGTNYGHPIFPIHSQLLVDRDETEDVLFDWSPEYYGSDSDEDDREWRKQEQEARKVVLAKCMQAFVTALQSMSGLTRFHWLVAQQQPSSAVFAVLQGCPALKDVDMFPQDLWGSHEILNPDIYGPWELSNLHKFSMDFREEFDQDVTQQYTTHMIKMLDRCPELEDLHLFPWHPTYLDTTQVFGHGHWPCLKRFTLRRMGDIGQEDDGVFNKFIGAHPKLERLYIDTDEFEAPNAKRVWSESLPNLKALHVGLGYDMKQFMTASTMRNLEFLSVVNLNSDSRDEHLSILTQIHTLRSLIVHRPHPSPELLARLALAVPWIERLQFSYGTYKSTLTASLIRTGQDEIFTARLAFISRLNRLTHLGLLIHVDADLDTTGDAALINTIIRGVANASKTLRYVKLGNRWLSRDWMAIERNEDGSYKGWQSAESLDGVSADHWGGFFIGAPRRAVLGF